MPQVHNRAMLNDGFSKGSIAHRAADFSITNRRVQAMGEMEKKAMSLKIKLITKNAQTQQNRWAKAERRLRESLKRTIAYGRVTRDHNISKLMGGPRYKSALNRNYTYKALRFDLLKMLSEMEPSNVRQEESKKKIDIAKDHVQGVINRNLASITTPRTNRREEARLAKEKKEAELRAKRMKPLYWLPRKTPLPPIENSILGPFAETPTESNTVPAHRPYDAMNVPKRELTLVETKGVVGKPHFQRPGQSREKTSGGQDKKVEDENNNVEEENEITTVTKGIEDMNVNNESNDANGQSERNDTNDAIDNNANHKEPIETKSEKDDNHDKTEIDT